MSTEAERGTKRQIAKPDPDTVKQVAECENCWNLIEKTKISKGWYHSSSGERDCN